MWDITQEDTLGFFNKSTAGERDKLGEGKGGALDEETQEIEKQMSCHRSYFRYSKCKKQNKNKKHFK